MGLFGNHIKELREARGISLTAFAKEINVGGSAVSEWENKNRIPRVEVIHKIASYFGVEFKMLNDLLKEDETIRLLNEGIKTDKDERTIPYYPDVNASAGLDFLMDNFSYNFIPMNIPNIDAQAFINVFGDSMYPLYNSGEIIGIKEVVKDMVFYGHAYVVQMIDGEAYLKYIKKGKDENHWILASENKRYDETEVHLAKIKKVFIIKAVIKKTTLT